MGYSLRCSLRLRVAVSRCPLTLAMFIALIASGCAPSASPPPTPAPTRLPVATSTPVPVSSLEYGVHMFIWGQSATTRRDLQLATDAGFHWQKTLFQWREIERTAKGQF